MTSIETNLQELEEKIKAQETKANRAITTSIVITGVLSLVILGYFTYISSILRDAAEPEGIASLVGDQISQQIPVISDNIQEYAREEAPKLVDEGITFLIDEKLPEGRQRAEETIKEQVTLYLDRYEDQVLDDFDAILTENLDEINRLSGNLLSDQGRVQFEEDLYGRIEQIITQDTNIMIELESYEMTLGTIAKVLEDISTGASEYETDSQVALNRIVALLLELARRSETGALME